MWQFMFHFLTQLAKGYIFRETINKCEVLEWKKNTFLNVFLLTSEYRKPFQTEYIEGYTVVYYAGPIFHYIPNKDSWWESFKFITDMPT